MIFNFLWIFGLNFALSSGGVPSSCKVGGTNPYFSNGGCICVLEDTSYSQFSGVLLGKKCVLTSGSLLLNFKGDMNQSIFFFPGKIAENRAPESLRKEGYGIEKIIFHPSFRLKNRDFLIINPLDNFESQRLGLLELEKEESILNPLKSQGGEILHESSGFDLALLVLKDAVPDNFYAVKIASFFHQEKICTSGNFSDREAKGQFLRHRVKPLDSVFYEKLFSFYSSSSFQPFENSQGQDSRDYVSLFLPGFIGGPLINDNGELVGICAQVRSSNFLLVAQSLLSLYGQNMNPGSYNYFVYNYIIHNINLFRKFSPVYNVFTNVILCKDWIKEQVAENEFFVK